MDSLQFMMLFARMQSGRGGVVGFVRTGEVISESGMPRTTVYYHLKKLVEIGVLSNPKRGKWMLNANSMLLDVGLCVVTPMDAIAYQNEVLKWQNS